MGYLTDLQILFLDFNELSSDIAPELGNLTDLRYLRLHDNQLSGAIPPELGDLSNLESLDLTANELTCWETGEVLLWASALPFGEWDDPPGTTICP